MYAALEVRQALQDGIEPLQAKLFRDKLILEPDLPLDDFDYKQHVSEKDRQLIDTALANEYKSPDVAAPVPELGMPSDRG